MSHNWRWTVNANETHRLCFVFQNWKGIHPLPHSNPTQSHKEQTTVFFPQQNHLKFNHMFHVPTVPTFKARGLEAKSKSGSMMSLSPGKMPWPKELTMVSTLAQINQCCVCWVAFYVYVFYLPATLVVWKGGQKAWLAWGYLAIKENTITIRFVSFRSGGFFPSSQGMMLDFEFENAADNAKRFIIMVMTAWLQSAYH